MEPLLVESWEQISTVPVAVAVALLVVEFLKRALRLGLGGIWWQRIAALTGVAWMIGVTLLGGVESPVGLAVIAAVINGLIAGVAASATYDKGRTGVEWLAEANE